MKKALPSHFVYDNSYDGRAKDGQTKLEGAGGMGPMDELAVGRIAWPQSRTAGCHRDRDVVCQRKEDRHLVAHMET